MLSSHRSDTLGFPPETSQALRVHVSITSKIAFERVKEDAGTSEDRIESITTYLST